MCTYIVHNIYICISHTSIFERFRPSAGTRWKRLQKGLMWWRLWQWMAWRYDIYSTLGMKKKILIIIITWKLKLRRWVLVKNDCIVSHRCPTSSSDYVFSFSSLPSIMTYTTNHCEWFYSIFSVKPARMFVFSFSIYRRTRAHIHINHE